MTHVMPEGDDDKPKSPSARRDTRKQAAPVSGKVLNFQRVTGASAEESSRLVDVFQQVGISGDVASSAMFRMNSRLEGTTPSTAKVADEVSFSDAGSYAAAGRTIASFHWDFSDGISKNGAFVQHDFSAPGTYTATLTVTDDLGNQSSKSATITITP